MQVSVQTRGEGGKKQCFLGQWTLPALCHAWQAARDSNSLSTNVFGNSGRRWGNRAGRRVAASGRLDLIAPATPIGLELCAHLACQQMAPSEVIALTVAQKSPQTA